MDHLIKAIASMKDKWDFPISLASLIQRSEWPAGLFFEPDELEAVFDPDELEAFFDPDELEDVLEPDAFEAILDPDELEATID